MKARRIGTVADRCEVGAHAAPRGHAHDHGPGHAHGDRDGGDHAHDHEHEHDHDHDHGAHAHDPARDRRRLLFTLGITTTILVAEVVGGLVAHSLALLSDAGHMLTDLSALVISLLAMLIAARPADARRTFGYHRLEILAALVNGLVLLALSGWLLYEAYQRLHAPPEVHTRVMILVAGIGLVANLLSARLLHGGHGLNLRGAYLHVLADTFSSAAVLAGAGVMAWRGIWVLDPILGILIACVVIFSAVRLIREAVDILLEAVPAGVDLEEVRAAVRGLPGIEDVHDLHIWTLTSGLHALSAHIVVRAGTHVAANDDLLTSVKQLLLRHHIAHSTIQIESTAYTHVD